MRPLARGLAGAVLALPLLVIGAGQLGVFAGHPPSDLGVRDGRLKAPASRPNSVSSQARLWPGPGAAQAEIEPLPAIGGAAAPALARLREVVAAMPGARIVEQRDDYLYVQFTTRWMGFVDDAEFWFDPAADVVQLRSASRLGHRDLGVNRARIEAIRAALTAGPGGRP